MFVCVNHSLKSLLKISILSEVMKVCVIGWMDRWMDGWIDGWMDRWMDGWMDDKWSN